jgi:hypothetical protein
MLHLVYKTILNHTHIKCSLFPRCRHSARTMRYVMECLYLHTYGDLTLVLNLSVWVMQDADECRVYDNWCGQDTKHGKQFSPVVTKISSSYSRCPVMMSFSWFIRGHCWIPGYTARACIFLNFDWTAVVLWHWFEHFQTLRILGNTLVEWRCNSGSEVHL